MNELDIPAYLTISQATNAAYFLWLKPSKDYPYDRGLCNDIQVKSVKLSDLTVISPAHQEVECLHGELTLMSQKVISRSSTNFTKPCSCPVAIEFGDGVANKTYLFWCDDDGNGISYSTTNTLGNTWTTAISIQEKTGGQGTKEKTSPCVAVFENKLYLFWVGSGNDGIWYTTTQDGLSWRKQTRVDISMSVKGQTSPCVAVFENKLYLFWVGSGNDGIWYTTTQDGLSWEEQTRVDIGMAIGEKTSPTAINFNKKLYLLWKGRGKDGFWFTSRKGGEKWEEQRRVYGVKNDESHLVEEDIILSSPSVAVGLGHLFLCWSEASKSFRGDWEYKLYVLKDPLAIRSLSTWMEDLFSGSREKTPLNEIFIPGTHDSATYNVTTDSDLAEIEIKEGRKNINYPKSFIAPWSKAQDTTIEKQLEAGIRFFDLRPCVKKYAKCDNDKPEFWISHSLFSVKLDDVLKQVKSFLEKNKKEIVILDLRYIWGFSTAADRTKYSEYLYDEICTSLGGKEKLIDFPPPYTPDASMPTIGEIWEDKGRVLLLWNVCSDNNGSGVSDKFMQDHSTFWDSGRWACKVGEGDQYNTAEKKIERINTQLEIMEQYKAFNCKALYLVKCEIDIGDDALAHIQDWLNGLKALAESNHKMIKHIEGCEGWSNKIKGGVFTFDYYNNCEVVDMIIALNNK